jgi:hypothetical protein
MSAVRGAIRRHPVLSYYGLVFTISWGGILAIVGPTGIPGTPADVERLFPMVLAALFAGPSVAGLVMTAWSGAGRGCGTCSNGCCAGAWPGSGGPSRS